MLVRVCRIRNETVTIRLPIQKPLLHAILREVDRKFLAGQQPQIYLGTLYKVIFITAYYGLLRIGEVAKGDHPVLARDVRTGINKKKLLFI